jgi:hypothetical protein
MRPKILPNDPGLRVATPAVIHESTSCVDAIRPTNSEFAMRKLFPILLMSLALASGAFAQTAAGGVTTSNDPAKAAAVEKHAQELKAHEAQHKAHAAAKPAAKSTHASTAPKAKSQTKKTSTGTKPSATK